MVLMVIWVEILPYAVLWIDWLPRYTQVFFDFAGCTTPKNSENWEPPRSTRSSTRSTTEPSLQPVQSRVKTDDSGRGQHRIVWIVSRRIPKRSALHALSYWSEGIVYCTCGHLWKETVANRSFMEYTLDLLSIPQYVINKGRPHGHRYGKLPGNKEYYLANNLEKRCIKKDYKGIHDRFLRDHIFRGRMIENSRDEEVCRAWDVLADEDHSYRMTESEYFSLQTKLMDLSQ